MIESVKEFDYIKIKLASPLRILQWANRRLPNGQFVGEVQKSETINYRTFKPEMDGLFCERIFGPSKSLECACGKYKRVRYEGLICDRCGVELTESRVRRHRMGYINLIYPVAHVWYINSRPNFLALLLEVEDIEKTFNTAYTVYSNECTKEKCCKKVKPTPRFKKVKPTPAKVVALWDERIKRIKLSSITYFIAEDEISFYGLHWDLQQYRHFRLIGSTNYPLKPYPKLRENKLRYHTPKYLLRATPNFLIGTPVIKRELEQLNLNAEIYRTRLFILNCSEILQKNPLYYQFSNWFRKWEQERLYKLRKQAIKRIRILENLLGTRANPAWMILTILPVIPPALRPMIQLEGGRFATSDLNELYRRIITRNNRLLRLLEIDAPQLIIRNEKRMLQEAVDTLIDNGKRGKIALSANHRPLKSLSDIIKGKYGRFRQNLLGKRVDYSGRSVIVVGPTLKLNQCGLPYEMALELFQPFIIRELINQGLASNMKIAKNLIQQNETIIDPVLEKVLRHHPIFLNRAPTLHRLGIQAFEPLLIQGRAIKLHPLVCSAFNADFDGDQMAVHIPLSLEAQAECYMLMFAPYNFLSPANGEPIIMPSQDMVLGCYYLTLTNISSLLGSNHYFSSFDDVLLAYQQDLLEIHSLIWVKDLFDLNEKTEIIKVHKLNDGSFIEYSKNLQVRKTGMNKKIIQYIKTTTGRVIFNYTIQKTVNLL
uniref:RNA polymerase beta' subunit n=1 Tax=Thalassionema bacillare TaxID=426664 RepID=UPI001EDED535|nr:RNA polymerase beta' subunit [Thalassionema bacillare]UHY40484.1 RNA polymerase beta' subunit [Thalassionema bacillare]UHY40871.1 RNA polymerase beta' subunit [Thalassionema bacillare]UHY41129.1 RNA polymerase beta' subunit [Thalassionema bacillare]